MLIRVNKKPGEYFQMHRHGIEDNSLSYKAKGILAYLMSKPDSWEVRISDLAKRSADGEGAVRSGLLELEKHGYMCRYPERDKEDGKITNWVCIVSEKPLDQEMRTDPEKRRRNNAGSEKPKTDNPFSGFPQVENPQVENPQVENRYPSNNDPSNNDSSNNEDKRLGDCVAVAPVDKKPSTKDALRHILEDRFCELTGLQHPRNVTQRERRAAGSMWYTPLREIAELATWNEHDALSLLEATVKHLLGQVTISAPNSIIKTARAAAAGTAPGVPWKREVRQGPQKRTIQIIDPETGDTIEVEAIV